MTLTTYSVSIHTSMMIHSFYLNTPKNKPPVIAAAAAADAANLTVSL